MSNELDPIIGTWYKHLGKGQMFVVVAVDEQESILELQHFDGDIEEVDMAAWKGMELELSEAPENWSAPVDNVELDDTGYSETQMSSADWREHIEENPRSSTEVWEDTSPGEERDDWGEGTPGEEVRPQEQLEDSDQASVREREIDEGEESET